jgi:hypothetical protein
MKFTEVMIAWNPGTDQITVGPWPDREGWTRGYMMKVGAKDLALRKMPPMMRLAQLFLHFNTAIVRDRIDPQVAHRAFLAIDEYRRHISADMLGAEDSDGEPFNIPWRDVVRDQMDHRVWTEAAP